MDKKIFTISKKKLFILLGVLFIIALTAININTRAQAQASWESSTTDDLVTSSDDDGYYDRDLTTTFPDGINFGGTDYDSLYIGTNGYITFGEGNSSFRPEGIEGWSDSNDYPIIAAQYDDIDVSKGGDIYYDQYSDYLVITFKNIAPFSTPVLYSDNGDEDNPDGNDLQIVLRKPSDYSSDDKDFIIEIRYVDISWHVSENVNGNATAGWSVGETDGAWKETSYSNIDDFHYHEDDSNDSSNSVGVYTWDVEGGVVQSAPTVDQTDVPDNTTYNSAESGGNITSDGGASITESGIVWSTSTAPTYSDNYSADGGTSTGSFISSTTDLNPDTTYYVRAYAENSVGIGYGPEESFTTPKKELTIDGSFAVNNKTYDSSTDATTTGNNLSLSGVLSDYEDVALTDVAAAFASSGVADGITVNIPSANVNGTDSDNYTLSLSGAPTTTADINKKELTVAADDKSRDYGEANPEFTTTYSGFAGEEDDSVLDTKPSPSCEATESSLAGDYDIAVSGGSDNNYSFNYATGTLTVQAIAPTVTTKEVSDIRTMTANGSGDVTSNGGEDTTVRGVCWSTSTDPTTSDNCTADGIGAGQFDSNITGLSPSTTYYVRAYATNSVDTIYGGEKSFTTNANAAPDDPSNPSPSDGAEKISINPTLEVGVSDPNADSMDVTFYNASNDDQIGIDSHVSDGGTASIDWNGLDNNTSYFWYAAVDDGSTTTISSEYSFVTKSKSGGGTPLHILRQKNSSSSAQGFASPKEEATKSEDEDQREKQEEENKEKKKEKKIQDLSGKASSVVEKVSNSEAQEIFNHEKEVTLNGTTSNIYKKLVKNEDASKKDDYSVMSFIHDGTPTTKRLGAGERAGVINSFRSAFGKIPRDITDWQDVIKIANGRWPGERSKKKEKEAQKDFEEIYNREADMVDPHDNAAVTIMAYGLRPDNRSTESEAAAIDTFKDIYGTSPQSAEHWDTVRAIAYSGAGK